MADDQNDTIMAQPGQDPVAEKADAPTTTTQPPWRHVMLDLETMGVHTSHSLVLSGALVPFSLAATGAVVSPSPLTFRTDLAEQLALGRVVEEKTQKWWQDQSPAARRHWADPTRTARFPVRSILELHGAVADLLATCDPAVRIWSNGIVFDLGNMENMFLTIGVPVPWAYNAGRDYRTLVRELREVRKGDLPTGAAHDPLADCLYQVANLWNHVPDEMLED